MDNKQYYASISINKVTSSKLRKILDVLFTSDIDLTDINLHISEAFVDEEKESIQDIIDELADDSAVSTRTVDSKQAYADYIEGQN